MPQTLKFAYIAILFVSLLNVVVFGFKCDTHEDCYKIFPTVIPETLKCVEGFCSIILLSSDLQPKPN
ncbi:unnamed protein product [Trifolium pratense]|uniref:Uncharacterized protein n=1 Tax=Trifolium pratense TaxID=57577 RepID=A0ACB0LM17_TRIPR|nr:unnamed protein product [Trifolium pratense]